MIKIGIKNIRFLETISKLPILKHFFILKISENFKNINSEPVLNKFYTDIYVSNKTSKKTEKNRFPELDKLCLIFLKELEIIAIHDIAVSNGISSLELFNLLIKEQIRSKFYISDKYSEVHVKKGFVTKAYSIENKLIFAYVGSFFAVDKNIFFPLTILLFKILNRSKFSGNYDYKLLLLHPKVIKQIETNKIAFLNYDIFTTNQPEQFSFVRAMNILNLGYFSKEQIKIGIQNIIKSMKENGILLVGRTNKQGTNNASFFKKENQKFIHIKDINDGSEVKHIIENI